MSRSLVKILSMVLFLFLALFPCLSRYRSRSAAFFSQSPEYGEGIENSPPCPAAGQWDGKLECTSHSSCALAEGQTPLLSQRRIPAARRTATFPWLTDQILPVQGAQENGEALLPEDGNGYTLSQSGETQAKSERVPGPEGEKEHESEGDARACALALQGAQRMVWQNGLLYTAGAQNFSILAPSGVQEAGVQEPVIVGSCLAPALCLAVAGQYAYLGSMDGKLSIIDISDPSHPSRISRTPSLDEEGGKGDNGGEKDDSEKDGSEKNDRQVFSSIQGVALLGSDLLVVSEKLKGLTLMSASPVDPKIVGQWKAAGEKSPVHYGSLAVWENKAAVLWESAAYLESLDSPRLTSGFWLIDLSRPQEPVATARVVTGSGPLEGDIAACGSHIFLTNTKEQTLDIYRIASSQKVYKTGSYPVGKVTRMLAKDDTLYLAQGDAGILCLDISVPDQPVLIGQKKSDGYCIDLAAGKGEIYLLTAEQKEQSAPGDAQGTICQAEQDSPDLVAQGTIGQETQDSQRLKVLGVTAQAKEEMALIPAFGSGQYLSNFFALSRPGWLLPFLRRRSDTGDSEPVIQSVSPSYAQIGVLMTLTGTRLSAQSCENWIHFSESQGSFEDTKGWKKETNCWVRDNWECWATSAAKRDSDVTFDSKVAIVGNQSYRNTIHYTQSDWKYARECPGKGEFYNLTWWDAPDADQYYYRYYVRYSGPAFKWTDNSWKQLYVHNLFNLNPCMWDKPPATCGPGRYDIQAQTRLFAHLQGPISLDRWYCVEIWAKKEGPGICLKFWLDGEECVIYDEYDKAPQQFPWNKCYQGKNQKLSFGSLELGTTNCQNWTYDQLPVNQSIWFDGFAMSSTRIYPAALVEIGNNPDYDKAKKVKQEILHISDTQIQFRADITGLGPGPCYVWITNNKQERSKAYSLKLKN
ncbi:MAG: hypothetical protein AB1847_04305 [bacterium]